MRSASIALCATLLASLSATASADDVEAVFPQQMEARQLLTFCASSNLTAKGRIQRRYCDGFVSGIEEGMRLFKFTSSAGSGLSACVPPGTNARALSQAFIQHATSKDVNLEQPAAAVVLEALQQGFPC